MPPESGTNTEDLTLRQSTPADNSEQNVRKRNKTPTKRQRPPHSPPLQKRILPATGSQTLTKKHTSRTFFASIRHCRDSFSAQQKIIRLKAIFQCPQNLRATCTKRRKTTFYCGEEMPKTLFFHVDESPTASKRKKNKTTAETPDRKTHKKSHAERHGTSSIEKKAPKTKGSILSDSRCTRIHYLRPLPARLANTPFSPARK